MTNRMPFARGPVSSTVALASFIAATASPLGAQGLTPEQLVSIQSVTSVAMHPDSGLIAYTVSRPVGESADPGPPNSELWVVTTDGAQRKRVILAPQSAAQPDWSPSGQFLTFVADLPDYPGRQIYLVSKPGEDEPRRLTSSPTGVLSYAWKPNGEAIVYTDRVEVPVEEQRQRELGSDQRVAGESRAIRLWLQSPDPRQREALTPEHLSVWSFEWSWDSQWLAIQTTESPSIDHSYMFRKLSKIPAAGGEPELLTGTPGKLGPMAWSPDGAMLAFVGAVSQNDPIAQSLFVVPTSGGAAVNRTAGYEGSVTTLGWLDENSVYFLANEGTKSKLKLVDPFDGPIRDWFLGGTTEVINSLSFDIMRTRVAAVAHTAAHPSEVFLWTVGSDSSVRVTTTNQWMADVQLAEQETIEWTSTDGMTIQGVLLRPLDEQPGRTYPLAVLPHGGPEGVSRDGWTSNALYPAQVLAARGYAVLMPNYRGSGGRGVAFSKGDHRDLGGQEFADVIAGIDHLAQQGLVDPDRVGISGTSYGGYFSAWATTRHPDRFKAGITFAGITNWISFTGTTDIPYEMSIVHWDLWWHDNFDLVWDRSPLAHVSENSSPTLIGHGARDQRVHPGQSDELYQTLTMNRVPTGLVVYPREPHGLRERRHQLDFTQRILRWLDEHVKGDTPATS